MGRLRPPLVRAAFVLFGSKVFLLGKIDHAEPGSDMSRHMCFSGTFLVHSALRRHSAALARYSFALVNQGIRRWPQGTVATISFSGFRS